MLNQNIVSRSTFKYSQIKYLFSSLHSLLKMGCDCRVPQGYTQLLIKTEELIRINAIGNNDNKNNCHIDKTTVQPQSDDNTKSSLSINKEEIVINNNNTNNNTSNNNNLNTMEQSQLENAIIPYYHEHSLLKKIFQLSSYIILE